MAPRRARSMPRRASRPTCRSGATAGPAWRGGAAGERPGLAHVAKGPGEGPAKVAFDSEVAGFLLAAARRGYPLDELSGERGIAVNSDDLQAQRAGVIVELASR